MSDYLQACFQQEQERADKLSDSLASLRAELAACLARAEKAEAERDQIDRASYAIFAEYHRILALFDCPLHGECTPYAIEQIGIMRTDLTAARRKNEELRDALRGIRGECALALEKGGDHYPERIGRIHGISTCALMAKDVRRDEGIHALPSEGKSDG